MSEGSDSGKAFAASPGSKAEFKIADSKSGLPDAFPPEMLAHILSHLSYTDLLVVRRVAKQWKAVVDSDFTLGVQMFKKASEVYVEAGDGYSREDTESGSEEIRMHPVLPMVSFILGNKVSDAVMYRKNGMNTELAVSGAANDLATIPAVHTFTIKIEEDLDEDFSFQVEVKNTEGVTVIDIFTALAKAAKRSVSTERGPESMADALGDHRLRMPEAHGNNVGSISPSGPPELAKLAIVNDLISIPAVTTLNIEITQNFNVVVKNNKGVRLVDVFTAMERESTREIKTRRGMVERYELLGDHRFFEGFTNLILRALDLSAVAGLGS